MAVHVLGNGAVIDNVELVDNEFKLLNMVVDILFKLVIDNVELVIVSASMCSYIRKIHAHTYPLRSTFCSFSPSYLQIVIDTLCSANDFMF